MTSETITSPVESKERDLDLIRTSCGSESSKASLVELDNQVKELEGYVLQYKNRDLQPEDFDQFQHKYSKFSKISSSE